MKLKGLVLLITAIICFARATELTARRYTPVTTESKQADATYLSIESANIFVPISENGVVHDNNTPKPGQKGNSVIYGHNWPSILGNLSEVKKGDHIRIQYKNGEQMVFVVQNTHTVWPSNATLLANTENTQITLYTCTGFLDTMRLVVTATPKDNLASY